MAGWRIEGRYQRKRALLLTGVDDVTTRAQIIRDLRQRHYPADTLAKWEALDHQQQLNDQRVLDYQQAVAALQHEMEAVRHTLSGVSYEQGPRQSRVQYFPGTRRPCTRRTHRAAQATRLFRNASCLLITLLNTGSK